MEPLGKLTCSSHACERDLHCFLRRRPRDKSYRNGRCVACDVDLIDWERIDKHDLGDASYTIRALEHELVRHAYWHKPLDDRALERAWKRGLVVLRQEAEKRIHTSVGPPRSEIFRDGTQTPTSGNVLYYAQHATATCCRRCIEAWHGIDRNRRLTGTEESYMVELVMLYVSRRLPELTADSGELPHPPR
ncbi:MAG: DUF4186 family protein [Bacillota bacterium]|nr:DUF4186 family protein [Bacillota bacterium]